MRGSIRKHPTKEGYWQLRYDLGVDADGKRKQKFEGFKGARKAAEQRLRDVLTSNGDGTYVAPRKTGLGRWMKDWWTTQQQVGKLRDSTVRRYGDVVRDVCKSSLALVQLQQLREAHLERFYATAPAGSRHIYHAVIRRALKRAVKERLIASNPAQGMDNAPRRARRRLTDEAEVNCWSAKEARAFLDAAKQADAQTAALFCLWIDIGARRSEILGLQWTDVDLDAGTVTISQQLLKGGSAPTFGPTKNSQTRVVGINAETVRLLKAHRKEQARLKMANRTGYTDHGLVFAKTWEEGLYTRKSQLGQPLERTHVGERMLDRLIKTAGIKRITTHGLRHTSATLQLLAGVPVHVVAARLGHSTVSMTLDVYSHALRDAHKDAAATLGKVLHGA